MTQNDVKGTRTLIKWDADHIVAGIIAFGLLILLVRVVFF